jgi:hypothetical protein
MSWKYQVSYVKSFGKNNVFQTFNDTLYIEFYQTYLSLTSFEME